MRKLSLIAVAALLSLILSLAPVQTQAVVQAQAATVVYNLYATDGYIEMADGVPVYAFGFVGGRENVPFTYTESYCTAQDIGGVIVRSCKDGPGPDPSTLVYGNIGGNAPAPTGGVWTANDALLAGNAQFPAPIIYSAVGDVVEIRLKNLGVAANPAAPNDPHSIHLHGLDVDAANDGVPETSLGAVPANMCADGTIAPTPTDPDGGCGAVGLAAGAGNVIVYMYSADHPGTYMYHCHQEANIHVNMGMFGALVVYNPGDPAAATGPGMGMGGELYGVPYDKDYVLLLGEFDIRGHANEEGTYITGGLMEPNTWDPDPFNWALYEPQYWFINGLSFPVTLHTNFPSGYTYMDWEAAHPGYDPLIKGTTGRVSGFVSPGWGTPGEKALIRVINMGFETQPMHMHGYHGKVIGSDARGWDWTFSPKSKTNKAGTRPFGEGLEKNTLTVGSGETYDWLIDFGQQDFQSTYPPGGLVPSPFGTATESRYYDGSTACQAHFGAGPFPDLNTPVSNTFTGCPPIPDNGGVEPGAPDYIAGPVVTGLMGHPDTNQYFPFHNHDDYKATNDGVYPGGMFTMIVPTP